MSKLRDKISAVYWDAVKQLGPLVPTPQVIGAGLAAAVTGLLNQYAIDLSIVGISPAIVVGAVSFGVLYLIGPERDPEGRRLTKFVPRAVFTDDPPHLQSVGTTDKPPEVPGEYVGPEDDHDAPGSGLV